MISTKALYMTFLFIAFSLFLFSCTEENKRDFTSDIVLPDSLVSFSKHIEPLFRETCVDARCHGGSQPAAGLNLEYNSWLEIIDHQPKIVTSGDGENSLLVLYIDNKVSGFQMPPPPIQPLTRNQIDGVKKWIDEGALPN